MQDFLENMMMGPYHIKFWVLLHSLMESYLFCISSFRYYFIMDGNRWRLLIPSVILTCQLTCQIALAYDKSICLVIQSLYHNPCSKLFWRSVFSWFVMIRELIIVNNNRIYYLHSFLENYSLAIFMCHYNL